MKQGLCAFSTAVFAVILLLPGCSSKKNTISPEFTDIVESVYASATIAAADQYMVIAPVTGLLEANLVQEGDSVTAGQVIARIDNTNPALNAENARLAMELSRRNLNNLDEIAAQIQTARRQLVQDSVNYTRQQELWRQEIGTRAQLESRQLAWEVSKNTVRALQVRYNQTRIQLLTAEQQAANTAAITARSSNDFVIRSLIAGRVYTLNYKPGEMVVPQQPVAMLGRAGQFILKLEVDEVDIARLKPGQKALVSMEAWQGKVFEARISRILPNMDSRSQTFRVEAEFMQQPPALYPGMSAEVNVVISEKKNAMVIPLDYLKGGDKVYTAQGKKTVKTGLRSLEKIEILEGISKETELKKPE
ncbi:MAG: efflux RND transporter periplasmic adaptor subunit [Bacteroidetes bacterium]|nr:efflux RND transporter periplasmic adaptor subunit [Bacteroidota bacterium]